MTNSLPARAHILKSIQQSLAKPGAALTKEGEAFARAYRRTGVLSIEDRISLFEECLREYDVRVQRIRREEIAGGIAERLHTLSKSKVAIPKSLPTEWLSEGIRFTPADFLSARELESFDSVLTGCTVAVAVSGSVVLQNAEAQGPRQLSLIPDFHLCIVFAEQIVETLPEAFERLANTATLPTTFISGPSATSDIEMTRVRGVHGPRTLDVLIAM